MPLITLEESNECNHECSGQINGRTLALALRAAPPGTRLGAFGATEWANICPICHETILRSSSNPWPYRCSQGVMRTVDDFDRDSGSYATHVLRFASFAHSRNALASAIGQQRDDPITKDTEARGRELLRAIRTNRATPLDFYQFSKAVHVWGRGQRVWANLNRFNGDRLATSLAAWLTDIPQLDVGEAIANGIRIKGLDVSFASKQLRMLEPERFGVLDEVLSQGLGYALNAQGFKLFLDQLRIYQREHWPDETIAFVEGGFFLLVRQGVRAGK